MTAPRRLFPLHLAPIDEFFLLDDRVNYPMTYCSNLYFSGELDRDALESALAEACERHPIFKAWIGEAKQGKLCWVSANGQSPQIDWGPIEEPVWSGFRTNTIDLRKEVGLRVCARVGAGRSCLVLQFHHACTDGTGAHRFIGDLLAIYGRRTASSTAVPTVEPLNAQMLKQRRHKLANLDTLKSAMRLIRRGLGQLFHIFGRRITPLAVPPSSQSKSLTADAYPDVLCLTLDRSEHQKLREAAVRNGVMLNDLLLSDIFLTIRDWNDVHGMGSRQRLRVMMPNDLRDIEDYAMPAANLTSYNFITRSARDCLNPRSFLLGIREETMRIKHNHLGREFVEALIAGKYIPGLLPSLVTEKRCFATVVVSNMGDPTRRFLATFPRHQGKLVCGNVILENMLGVPPLRALTRATVSIVTLYRELKINLRCDPRCMSLDHTRSFLEMYAARLRGHL